MVTIPQVGHFKLNFIHSTLVFPIKKRKNENIYFVEDAI